MSVGVTAAEPDRVNAAATSVADIVATLVFDLMVSVALQAALIPVLAGLVAAPTVDREDVRRVTLIADSGYGEG